MTLRESASKILGMRIPEHGWRISLIEMWATGRPGPKQMKELVFLLLEKVEQLEEELDGRTKQSENTPV